MYVIPARRIHVSAVTHYRLITLTEEFNFARAAALPACPVLGDLWTFDPTSEISQPKHQLHF